MRALVCSSSSAVFSAFENYFRLQDQEYLETFIFITCNSYFHLLLCAAFGLEQLKIVKIHIRDCESKTQEILENYGKDGNTEGLVHALAKVLEFKLVDGVNYWDDVLRMVEDLDPNYELEQL